MIFGYVLKYTPGCYRLDREKGRKMSKLKLLYGESNEDVLASQAAELQKAGYAVQTAIGRKAVQELLNNHLSWWCWDRRSAATTAIIFLIW